MWYIASTGILVLKNNELLSYTMAIMTIKTYILSERSQLQQSTHYMTSLCYMQNRHVHIDSGIVVSRDSGVGGIGGQLLEDDKMFCN